MRRTRWFVSLVALVFVAISCAQPQPAKRSVIRSPWPPAKTLTALDVKGTPSATTNLAPTPRVSNVQPTPTPIPAGAITKLLARQGQAVLAGDKLTFLSAIFDERPAAYNRLSQRFDQMASLPLADYELTPQSPLSKPTHQNGRWIVQHQPVTQRFRFEGLPRSQVFRYHVDYSFVRTGKDWLVLDYVTPPLFWTQGPTAVERSPHFLVFYRPSDVDRMTSVTQDAETAYAELRSETSLPLQGAYPIFLMQDTRNFAILIRQLVRDRPAETVARYHVSDQGVTITNIAMYINGPGLEEGATTSAQRQYILRHEMVHLALAPAARPWTPAWLAEGIAQHYAGSVPWTLLNAEATPDDLLTLSLQDLTTHRELGGSRRSQAHTNLEYLYSAAVVEYLTQTYGEPTLVSFYQSFADISVDRVQEQFPGWLSGKVDSASRGQVAFWAMQGRLSDMYSLTLEELEDVAETWIQQQIAGTGTD